MKIRSLLLGTLAISGGFGGWASAMPDDGWVMPSFYAGGGSPSRHRASGSRAHRKWRKVRSAGRR